MKARGMKMRVDAARLSPDFASGPSLVLEDYCDGDVERRVSVRLDHATVRALLDPLKEWLREEERACRNTRADFEVAP